MAGECERRSLALARRLVLQGMSEHQWEAVVEGLDSLIQVLPEADALDLLQRGLGGVAEGLSNQLPHLAWAQGVIAQLTRAGNPAALRRVIEQEWEVRRYYEPIRDYLQSVSIGLFAAECVQRGHPAKEGIRQSLLGGLAAAQTLDWAFRCPDEYAASWARDAWSKWQEGTPPPEAPGPPAGVLLLLDPVRGPLTEVLKWLDCYIAKEHGEGAPTH